MKNSNIFFDQLTYFKPMIVMHSAIVLGEIAKKYPEFAEKITDNMLALEKYEFLPQRELVMGYIIESFEGDQKYPQYGALATGCCL